MKWIRVLVLLLISSLGIYGSNFFFKRMSEDRVGTFSVEKEIPFGVEDLFPQFNNLQNLSSWYKFLPKHEDLSFTYYTPYEGEGSSMSYCRRKDTVVCGELRIHAKESMKSLRYGLYNREEKYSCLVDVSFHPVGSNLTKLIWNVTFPKESETFFRKTEKAAREKFLINTEQSLSVLVDILKKEKLRDEEDVK